MERLKDLIRNPRVRRVAADVLARIAQELQQMAAQERPRRGR